MSKYYDRAVELRAITKPHYNCAQAVVLPFAEDAGIDEKTAFHIAANFGAGMKRAATCGSITGGLMVLGLFGVDDPGVIADYHKRLRDRHQGNLECADLLRMNKEAGKEKKSHCDDMVYECVGLAEDILREQGKLECL
ncbi:MAG: C-GCAxxG-C-C family protein [Hespellia sp.]|nr:C-GCAxxG-C-C family protein [Hespellia sp.]